MVKKLGSKAVEKQEVKKRKKAWKMAKKRHAQEKRAVKQLAKQERAEQKQATKKLAKQECPKEKGVAKQLANQELAKEKLPASKTARGKRPGKKASLSEFQRMVATLSGSEQSQLREYFQQLDRHILLPKEWKTPMLHDFEQGILYHLQKGRSLADTLELLDPINLGGFYSCPATMWWPLDNAAKVYPISMSHDQMEVFRLSVYLKEEVVPEILQLALTFTIKRFPFFATTIKNGFFWHYIDATKRRFAVEPESAIPCAPINVSSTGAQSFRIIYYHNRISAEFFHILTDGTGGMVFLKSLIAEYLRLLGIVIPNTHGVLDINERPSPVESADDFAKSAVRGEKGSGFVGKPALQMSGYLTKTKPCQVLHFDIDAAALHQLAKERQASVTAYVLALMFVAGKAATEADSGNIQIQVPVNMRNFYPSETIRNFSLYCSIKMPINDITTIDEILPEISCQLQENTSRDAMHEMMNAAVNLVRSLKYVPLFIKTTFGNFVYGFFSDRIFSNTLSNLGVVDIPEEMRPYVEKMDFLLGMSPTNRAACSMVTVNNVATFSIAKATIDPSFEEKINALLTENGLEFAVSGSEIYGD